MFALEPFCSLSDARYSKFVYFFQVGPFFDAPLLAQHDTNAPKLDPVK
jgi:hypothetical protein